MDDTVGRVDRAPDAAGQRDGRSVPVGSTMEILRVIVSVARDGDQRLWLTMEPGHEAGDVMAHFGPGETVEVVGHNQDGSVTLASINPDGTTGHPVTAYPIDHRLAQEILRFTP